MIEQSSSIRMVIIHLEGVWSSSRASGETVEGIPWSSIQQYRSRDLELSTSSAKVHFDKYPLYVYIVCGG
jgi:hypothetical protein